MIKRIFISILMFLFFINSSFANSIPYFNINNVKFDKVIGYLFIDSGTIDGTIYSKSIDNQYIVYRRENTGTYRLNINSLTNEKISFGNTEKVLFSSDNNYMYYYDRHGGGFVKQNTNDLSKIVITNNVSSYSYDISSDNNYIIYSHGAQPNFLYKKNVNDIGGEGTQINNQPSSAVKVVGNYVYYNNQSGVIYKKDINNLDINDNGEVFINGGVTHQMTSDGEYLYYRNENDLGRIYRKKLDGTENPELFSMVVRAENMYYDNTTNNIIFGGSPNVVYRQSVQNDIGSYSNKIIDTYSTSYIDDGNGFLYYIKDGKIYKINILNPVGFDMSKTYNSPIISNNSSNVYINASSNIEEGVTWFDFFIGNSIEELSIELNESVNNYIGYDNYMFNDGITPNINIGDTVILFKNSLQTEPLTVTQVGGNFLGFDKATGFDFSDGWGLKKIYQGYLKLNNSVLDGNTEINTQTVFGNTTDKLFYQIVLFSTDSTKTPIINSVTITATPQTVVNPPENNGGENPSTSTGGVNLNIGDGTSISIPSEKQTTDFIKSLATLPSINPASLNTYSNVEKFLKDNNYDYKNQILIGSGSVPDNGMYTIINLGLNDNSLSNTLSGAINSTNYSKLILTPETYLAGKRIINYLKMDKADDNGNLIISVYNSDTKEYIFLKPKN